MIIYGIFHIYNSRFISFTRVLYRNFFLARAECSSVCHLRVYFHFSTHSHVFGVCAHFTSKFILAQYETVKCLFIINWIPNYVRCTNEAHGKSLHIKISLKSCVKMTDISHFEKVGIRMVWGFRNIQVFWTIFFGSTCRNFCITPHNFSSHSTK